MRLQQNFFWWIAISAILPLTALILSLTLYGERLYLLQVSEEVNTALNNIGTDMERSLAYERSIMLQAAESAAMRQYLPVLEAARDGELHKDFYPRTDRLNRFLLSFSRIVHGQGTLRVLDIQGNTLIKVGLGRMALPTFDGLEGFPYAEEERNETGRPMQQLEELKQGEVSFLPLINEPGRVLLDGVVPLSHKGERVGYLVTSLLGQQLDFIMQLAHRPYQGKLSLIEVNPDSAEKNGRILYDDARSLLFAEPGRNVEYEAEDLLGAILDRPDGHIVDRSEAFTLYYSETFPYPDRLLSWAIVMRINNEMIRTPFQRLRYGVLFFAVITLLVSLMAAHFGARHIARPLALLIDNFRALAKGEQTKPITTQGTEEIDELNQAFEDLQYNLASTQEERDRARDMMMQNAKLASIGQLAAGIGHELNNPLNNILSYTKLIERELPNDLDSVVEDVKAIREESERASRIIKGILSFSRQLPANFVEFSVLEWLHQTVNLVKAAAASKEVNVRLQADDEIEIYADRGLLQQALINLLINAIQASPKGGEVILRCVQSGEHLSFHVMDNGDGISDQDIDRLFEPFYTTKEIGEGSGLGLSITLGIVEQHQGALQIENRLSEDGDVLGAMATVVLPKHGNP